MALLPLSVCLCNFPARYRGRVSGLLYMFSYVGISSAVSVYSAFFNGGPIGNYFLMLTIAGSLVNALCLWLLRPVPVDLEEDTETECLIPKTGLFVDKSEESDSLADKIGWTHFRKLEFQLLMWGFLLSGSIKLMYLPNITIMAKAYGCMDMGDLLAMIGPICAMAAAAAVGPLSDCTRNILPRSTYLVLGAISQTIIFLVSYFYGNNIYVFTTTTVLVYIDLGILFSTTINVIGEYFGMRHFARNWGLLTMLSALLALLTCAIFAIFYEVAILQQLITQCYGLKCFKNTYMFSHICCLIPAILFTILCYKDKKQREKYRVLP